MVLVSVSLVMTVLILNVFYHGSNGRRVPAWVKKYIILGIGRLVCINKKSTQITEVRTVSHNEKVCCFSLF